MSLMIDWVSVVLSIPHATPINNGNVVSIDVDGEIEWKTDKRLSVEGSYGSSIQIRSEGQEGEGLYTKIRLDGNLVKWWQGHNVFGSDDLLGLITATLCSILPRVAPDIRLSDEIISLYVLCARLTRVDVNGMYDLGNEHRVMTWLRAAQDSANLRHRGRGQFRGDTLYWAEHSRRWSLKMYSKGQELKAHKPKKGITDHPHYLQSVTDFASRALRVELTLRGMELDRLGLLSVQDWREGVAESVYTSYLSGLEFSQNMKVASDLPDFSKLPARLVGPVQLWHSGHDLREFYPKRTWYRYRQEIKQLIGLDVSLPPPVSKPEKSNVVPLITVLEAKPMGIPDWAIGTPLYFEPPIYKASSF